MNATRRPCVEFWDITLQSNLEYAQGVDKGYTEFVSPGKKVTLLKKQLDREGYGISVEAYAEMLGVTRTGYYAYDRKTRPVSPPAEAIKQLTDRLLADYGVQVPLVWFFNGEKGDAPLERGDAKFLPNPESEAPTADAMAQGERVELPLWRGVKASPDVHAMLIDEGEPETFPVLKMFLAGSREPHVVGVAAGRSMHPRIKQGEHVVIRLNTTPSDGMIVVARKEGLGNYIKVYREFPDRVELQSLNVGYPTIVADEEWTYRGYAVAILKPYTGKGSNIEWDEGRPLRA